MSPILKPLSPDPLDALIPGLSDLVFPDSVTEIRYTRLPGAPDEYELRLTPRAEAMAGFRPGAEACGRLTDQVLARVREAGFRVLSFASDIVAEPGTDVVNFAGELLDREPDRWQTEIRLRLAPR